MVVLKMASKLIVFLISFGFVCLGTEWVPLFIKMTAFLMVLAIATIIGISVDTLQKRNLFIS